ncbi:MAG: hypothetical protein Tsb0013_24400 [Phycisphaerales bacterium]
MQFCTALSAVSALAFVASANAGVLDTLEFEDLNTGDIFSTGTPFVTEGITVTTNEFFFFPGPGSTTDGFAQVIDPNMAGGGKGIFANNTNLDFGFVYPQDIITFSYANEGGNVNLLINGTLLNAGVLVDLDGTMVGDVTVSVSTPGMGVDAGTVTLQGTITGFAVGGQEFNLDNIRYTVPAPGTAALGLIALLGSRRKR